MPQIMNHIAGRKIIARNIDGLLFINILLIIYEFVFIFVDETAA